MTGVLAPMKGKTISCSPQSGITAYSMVDIGGTVYTRCKAHTSDSGWVVGLSATASYTGTCRAKTEANGVSGSFKSSSYPYDTTECSANWPLN